MYSYSYSCSYSQNHSDRDMYLYMYIYTRTGIPRTHTNTCTHSRKYTDIQTTQTNIQRESVAWRTEHVDARSLVDACRRCVGVLCSLCRYAHCQAKRKLVFPLCLEMTASSCGRSRGYWVFARPNWTLPHWNPRCSCAAPCYGFWSSGSNGISLVWTEPRMPKSTRLQSLETPLEAPCRTGFASGLFPVFFFPRDGASHADPTLTHCD